MDLRALASAWLGHDPDPETRAAGEALLASGDENALRDAFGARLQFGTAGLRGALGPGPNRMNRVLVRKVTAGLGHYLRAHGSNRRVVVGYDARRNSRIFAEDTAAVLAVLGFEVWLSDDVIPTPRIAHAVVFGGAAAGIVVTASHNPPEDNGYKVFWADGAQIIPPHDAGISAAVDAAAFVDDLPAIEGLQASGRITPIPDAVFADYLAKVQALRVHADHGITVAYTPMHGVGWFSVRQVLARAGYDDVYAVPEQVEPNSAFPTVRFPNPEEPGAMDLLLELATRVSADVAVANDPDADRLAVAVPKPGGGWRVLSGNEIGCLLAEDLLMHGPKGDKRLVATTIVSTTLLSRIAAHHGADYAETLTGFKWIASRAIAYDADGGRFVMGFEEALGSSSGPVVRDKDGVSALLLFCDLVADCKAKGDTVHDRLDALARRHGLHVGGQKSLTLKGEAGARRIRELIEGIRSKPPAEVGGVKVVRMQDLGKGVQRDLVTGRETKIDLPASDVLSFDLADGSRCLVRPSGTEPKIKYYFEVVELVREGEAVASADSRARVRLAALQMAFVPAS